MFLRIKGKKDSTDLTSVREKCDPADVVRQLRFPFFLFFFVISSNLPRCNDEGSETFTFSGALISFSLQRQAKMIDFRPCPPLVR